MHFRSIIVDLKFGSHDCGNVDAESIRRSMIGFAQVSMSVLAMMDAVMLLGELAPQVPRNVSFLAGHADNKELTV